VTATPASHLANLRARFGTRWRVEQHTVEVATGPSYVTFTARERGGSRTLQDSTLVGLEAQLVRVEGERKPEP
jgi:hypothetical protein